MDKIKELRQIYNLTQKELAEKIGFNATAIGKYERGQLEPNIDTLKKLSTIFDVSIDYLLGLEDDVEIKPISFQNKKSSPALSAEEQELLNDFRSLPRPEKAQAAAYVQYLAEKRGNKNKNA